MRIPWRNEELLGGESMRRYRDDLAGDSLQLVQSQRIQSEYEDIRQRDDYSFDPSNAVNMQNNEFDNESSPTPSSFQSSSTNHHNHYEPSSLHPNYLYSHQDHISMATKVAPLWFTSNYFYALSLEWTTIASSTVLASMGSLFAFGFATCSSFGDEKITKAKLLGVALCFVGGVATTYTDVARENKEGDVDVNDDLVLVDAHYYYGRYLRHSPHIVTIDNPSSVWGDLAGLVSAIGYGAYTVLLRHLCPKDEKRMSMQLFFGYVGLLNMVILLPGALWVLFSSSQEDDESGHQTNLDNNTNETSNTPQENTTSSSHTTITWSIFLFLILKGLLDNVLSDYLWARAVILTSATVASVSVGLTIPMAFVADILMGNEDTHSKGQIVGAVLVLFGFVFVNLDGEGGSRRDESTDIGVGIGDDDDGEIEFEDSTGFDSEQEEEEEVSDLNLVM